MNRPPAWFRAVSESFRKPAADEVAAFVADPSPDAYEQLLDRFLASAHYGERWARHWLDIAHYADTHGFERDQLRPNAWRYRDWVIRAINAVMPYDEFLRCQIAGDVIAAEDPKRVTATGFLAAGPWDFVGQVETKSEVLRRQARAHEARQRRLHPEWAGRGARDHDRPDRDGPTRDEQGWLGRHP